MTAKRPSAGRGRSERRGPLPRGPRPPAASAEPGPRTPKPRAGSRVARKAGPEGAPVTKFIVTSEPRAPRTAKTEAAAEVETISVGVQTMTVAADEADMRVDRFLEAHFPKLPFSHIQRIVRKGELRVDGKRVETKDRLLAG